MGDHENIILACILYFVYFTAQTCIETDVQALLRYCTPILMPFREHLSICEAQAIWQLWDPTFSPILFSLVNSKKMKSVHQCIHFKGRQPTQTVIDRHAVKSVLMATAQVQMIDYEPAVNADADKMAPSTITNLSTERVAFPPSASLLSCFFLSCYTSFVSV